MPNSLILPVVVVGAGSGIGRCLAERLAKSGTPIVGVGRRLTLLEETAAALPAPELMSCYSADVTNEESVVNLFVQIKEQFGSIGGVVNCAGSVLLKPTHLTSSAEFDQTFAINVRSCFLLLRNAVPLFSEAGGSIVFFSTAAARAAVANHDVIAAAKSAVEGLTRSAAATYAGKKLRINAIAPGLVKTPLTERIHGSPAAAQSSTAMHALGRLGEADEIASLAQWLLSEEASWMSGQTIAFDGGLSLRSR